MYLYIIICACVCSAWLECPDFSCLELKQPTTALFPPVSLWLFGAHVGVRRLLGDKDTANLAQLLVHLKF